MKGTSIALRTHMAGTWTTLASLVSVMRTDGVVLALTDHDIDIVFGGVTYRANPGVSASDIEASAALDVDNLDVNGFLSELGITEDAVAAGLWDFAAVRVSRVNWRDLSMGDDKLKAGWIGQVSLGRNSFVNEVRGVTQKLQQTIGESYSPSCKADLFDARCKVVPIEGVWKFSGVAVGIVSDAARVFASGALTQAADFFTAGKVEWTLGDNVGLAKEIRLFEFGGIVTLQEPMPQPITVGDTFTIYAGCQKRWEVDCVGKFANGKNHRGFPFLPGDDLTLRGY